MSGFADLVPVSLPAYFGGGMIAEATEGTDWQFNGTDFHDSAGDPIDFTADGIVATCNVLTGVNGTPLVSLTFTGKADGSFTLTATSTQTADLVTDNGPLRAVWSASLTNGAKTVQLWGPSNSPFVIRSN